MLSACVMPVGNGILSGWLPQGYTPPGRDLYCSPCSLYGPTYRSSPHIPLEEVMWQAGKEVIQITSSEVIWITSSGGYLNFEFLDLKANALPLHQAWTCMSKVGTM